MQISPVAAFVTHSLAATGWPLASSRNAPRMTPFGAEPVCPLMGSSSAPEVKTGIELRISRRER